MNIWFDPASRSLPLKMKECKDCSRAAPDPERQDRLSALIEEALFQGKPLVQTSPLYLRACAPERWLVCHPTGSGHLAVLDREALELFNTFRTPHPVSSVLEQRGSWSSDLITHLVRLGLLTGAETPARLVFPGETMTLSAWLHVSNACNLACSYCYVNKTPEHMTQEIAARSVDAIFRSALRRGVKHLHLRYAGGEASLVMPRVCRLHDYAMRQAEEHGIHLHTFLLSNGVVLPQKTIDALTTRQIGLMISLDGIGAAHDAQRPFANGMGSFRYVERTLQRLHANDLTPHMSVTISQRNLAGMPELIHYLFAHDLPFSLNYYRETACSSHLPGLRFVNEQMIETMRRVFAIIEEQLPPRSLLASLLDKADLESPHQHTCGVGRNYLVIDQQGGIAKCHADIRRTVTTIDAADPLHTIQQDRTGFQNVPVEEKAGCRSCQWRYWCTGGCPLLTWKMTGRNDVQSPNCEIYQALFPEVLRLEALRLLAYVPPVVSSPGEGMGVGSR